jgi:hypothetical protein
MKIEFDIKDLNDGARWHLISVLLSMEKTNPFWPEMGLKLQHADRLREIAQEFVAKYRWIENLPEEPSLQKLNQFREILNKMFESIVAEVGEDEALRLFEWGKNTFQYGTELGSQLFIWHLLFKRLIGQGDLSYDLVPPNLPPNILEQIRNLITKHFAGVNSLYLRIKTVEEKPHTPWEEQIYASYGKDMSPMDWVEETIRFVRTRDAWIEITQILGIQQIDALAAWAKKQADVMRIGSNLVRVPNIHNLEEMT